MLKGIAYVDGDYVESAHAKVSIFDRGYLFADAVYEVTPTQRGKLIDFDHHTSRLERSLAQLRIAMPCTADELLKIHRELIRRNTLEDGLIYMQVSRGVADRDFAWSSDMKPVLIAFTQHKTFPTEMPEARDIISVPEIRWRHRDIKGTQLVAASMAKMDALERGCYDAWFVENGLITEGTSNNCFIVTKDLHLVTRNLSRDLLPGITRRKFLLSCEKLGLTIEERSFSPAEVMDSREAFATSSGALVIPVKSFDGITIGDGTAGKYTRALHEHYIDGLADRTI